MSRQARPGPQRQFGKQKVTLVVLLVLALGTVFILPRFVTDPWFGGGDADVAEAPDTGPSYIAPSTAAEKTRYRQDSQSVLAQIVAIRDRLREQQVESWAEVDFNQALQKVEDGDEQYSYGEYRASLDNYEAALDRLSALETLGAEKLAQALADGLEAIESLNLSVAASAGELVARIAPEDPGVQAFTSRLAVLPQLAAEIEKGDQARGDGALAKAEAAYTEALRLDPAHRRASESLAAVRLAITDSGFRGHMSRGYAALDNNDFAAARGAFQAAGRFYPGNAAVRQALAQVDNRRSQMLVSEQVRQAAQLEADEEWAQAVSVYETLLAGDPTLTEAKVKLIPARVRADLDQRIETIFEDPLKMSDPAVYRAARVTLTDARGIANPGARLQGQVTRLDRLVKAALLPMTVVFQSDNLTQVTLFRVTELGRFEQTSLQLKPGKYVAGGTRQGYRDVRVEFTITGEPLDGPIVVRCEESI